jgi:PKD repeat protein
MRRLVWPVLWIAALFLSGCFLLQNSVPVAVLNATPQEGECPLHVSFTGASSYDSDGSIVDHSWEFGDGWTSDGATCEHTYTTPGEFTVKLTVTDDSGDTGSATLTIRVLAVETFDSIFFWTSHGDDWQWEIEVPKSLYWHYRNQSPRSRCYDWGPCDWYKYVTDPDDDAYVESLSTNLLDAISGSYSDATSLYYGFLQFCLDFVSAAIPYTFDALPDEWPRYPLETLVEGRGDCEDTGILFASIVRPYVSSVHLLFFPTHVAAAVPADWAFIAGSPYEVGYYLHEGVYFVMVETTGDPPSYWRIGELPSGLAADWGGGNVWFYDVGARTGITSQALVHSP